jgi:hypothetical protein
LLPKWRIDKVFWIPEVPAIDHYLDDLGTEENDWTVNKHWESPNYLFMFGGYDGEHLSALCRIKGSFNPKGNLQGLEFEYSSEINGSKIHHWGSPFPCWALSTLEGGLDPSQHQSFDIDGVRGERITRLDIRYNHIPRSMPPIPRPIMAMKVSYTSVMWKLCIT